MDIRIENGVIIGEDEQLFLASERHNTIDLLSGKVPIHRNSFTYFARNLKSRREIATQAGARYVHLVAPDKHSVLREEFPFKEFTPVAETYREKTGADFLFPVQALRASSPLKGYCRTDTHWSIRGRIAIAAELARALGFDEATIAARTATLSALVKPTEQPFVGDLGGRFTPPRDEPGEVLAPDWRIHAFSNGVTSGNHGRINLMISDYPEAQGRLVIFGDSFLAQTLQALTAYFKEILFCRTRFLHREIVLNAAPDYIITENVERYLSAVSSDAEAPPMLLMAPMMGRPARYDGDNVRALGAFLSSRTGSAYRKFLDGLAEKAVEA